VSKNSLHRLYHLDGFYDVGYRAPDTVALISRQSGRAVSWDLEGLELMLNLKEISIECCPSEFWGTRRRGSDHVEMTERLSTEEGDRWLNVRTVIEDESIIDWDEPSIDMYDFPISALTKLVIYPTTPSTFRADLDDRDDRNDRTIRTLYSRDVDRLRDLQSLSILGEKITVEILGFILVDCPELRMLEVDLCSAWANWFPDRLLDYIEREHRLTDARILAAELDWLPYLRRCKKLVLPSCRCRIGEQAFSPTPSLVARVAAECTVPVNLEELNLDLLITDITTRSEANAVIEFIKTNTTEQTRITITASKDPRDDDSLGTSEITLSQVDGDSDDSDDSDSDGHSADNKECAGSDDRDSSEDSADIEDMSPAQRKEMRRAHKAILRYAASERARWS
jgi:hypothetical protein